MKRLLMIVFVLTLICGSAQAALIAGVVRANGQSVSGTSTGNWLQTTPPSAFDGNTAPLKGDYPGTGNWGWQLTGTNKVFSDRAGHNWNSPTNVIPAALLNSEYVRTFNTDKAKAETDVTYAVTISGEATVWITIDDRSLTTTTGWGTTAPWGTVAPASLQVVADWVTDAIGPAGTFTDSGLDLLIWESTSTTARPMSVFSAVLAAGTYTFGEMPSGNNFYTVGVIGAIPEPTTIALLGLGGLTLLRSRKRS